MKLYPASVDASTDSAYGLFYNHFRALDDNGKPLSKKTDISWSFDAGTTSLIMNSDGKLHKRFPLVYSGGTLTSGTATITATVGTDTATATINIGGATPPPVNPAILTSAAFSPKTASFTQNSNVGTYTNTIVCDASDDGSYTYAAPKLSGNAAAGLTATISGATVTITGTPTTAGTAYCDVTVTDSYATKRGAELSITINAATPTGINIAGSSIVVGAGTASTYNQTGKPYSRNWFIKTFTSSTGSAITDDGTLIYKWNWVKDTKDNYTGDQIGLVFDPDDAANIMIDGTPTKASACHLTVSATDVYGNTITSGEQGLTIN